MNTSMANFNAIQASEDKRINICAFTQLHALRNSKDFDPDKTYYLQRDIGGGSASADEVVFNSLVDLAGKNRNSVSFTDRAKIEHFIENSIGRDLMTYRVQKADQTFKGGFTYNSTKKYFDEEVKNAVEFKNSVVSGLPFTFGVSPNNIAAPMAEISSFDVLGEYELMSPTGSTLFSAAEVFSTLNYDGEPSDITNGATTLGQAAMGGEYRTAPYKVIGLGITEPTSMISGATGFSGDNVLLSNFGIGIQIAKSKISLALMRDFYNALDTAVDSAGAKYVPTYKMSDIDASLNVTFGNLFKNAAGVGEFATKVIKPLLSNNQYLSTDQVMLKRMVVHTIYTGVFNSFFTYGFSGGTTGQVPVQSKFSDLYPDLKVFFGRDIVSNPEPTDLEQRMLLLADPVSPNANSIHRAIMMSIAVSPTVMASYSGIGFTNQTLIAKYTLPEVIAHKRAIFLIGEQ